MRTLDNLRELGALVDDGMERCLNNESLYLKLVGMSVEDEKYGLLRTAVEEKNLKKGFEYAHALKGMLANVALTNLLIPVEEITEALRHEEDIDYAPLLDKMDSELAKLRAL